MSVNNFLPQLNTNEHIMMPPGLLTEQNSNDKNSDDQHDTIYLPPFRKKNESMFNPQQSWGLSLLNKSTQIVSPDLDRRIETETDSFGIGPSHAKRVTETTFGGPTRPVVESEKKKFIMSYGVIAFYTDKTDGKMYFCLYKRRDSFSWIDLLRGKWKSNKNQTIDTLISTLTNEELERLKMYWDDFDTLWNDLFPIKEDCKMYEYSDQPRKIYASIQKEIPNILDKIKEGGISVKTFQWGFPKGRKDRPSESPFACALREFQEETNHELDVSDKYSKLFNPNGKVVTMVEKYVGSDGRNYRTMYFPVEFDSKFESEILYSNGKCLRKKQISQEASDVSWMTYDEIVENNLVDQQKQYMLRQIINYKKK